jgi:hypothetical protein
LMSQGLTENQERDRGKNSTYPDNHSEFWSLCPDGNMFRHS